MDKMDLESLRDMLIKLRDECLVSSNVDVNGAVILSHTIRWLYFKIKGIPYEEPKD